MKHKNAIMTAERNGNDREEHLIMIERLSSARCRVVPAPRERGFAFKTRQTRRVLLMKTP
jgi:hypothetical protein